MKDPGPIGINEYKKRVECRKATNGVKTISKSEFNQTNALLEAIYDSALDASQWLRLRQLMLKNFRQDLLVVEPHSPWLSTVKNHLRRSLKIAVSQERLQQERARLTHFIDAISPAIYLIDFDGFLLGKNVAAKHSLTTDKFFGVCNSRLTCVYPRWLSQMTSLVQVEGFVSQLLKNSDQGERLVCFYRHGGSCAVVVFEQMDALEQALLKLVHLYHLSDNESQIIRALIRGESPQAIAVSRGIGYQSVRRHLSRIYAKTGQLGQSDLLALLLRNTLIQQTVWDQQGEMWPQVLGLAYSHFVEVRGGRQLCYAQYGDPTGRPVIYFSMLNGSRLELLMHHELLQKMGVRLIAIDRPGYGHSDYYDYPSYCDYMEDIARMLDLLALDRFHVLACSAGTPHGLACAAMLPERVEKIICAGSVPPYEHITALASKQSMSYLLNNLFRVSPVLLRPALELMLRGQTAQSIFQTVTSSVHTDWFTHSDLDVRFLKDPANKHYVIGYMIESLRQGSRAWAKEIAMLNQPWQIPFERIRCPVRFWHGNKDGLVTPNMVQSFAAEMGDSRVEVLNDESHLLVFRHLERILS